MMVCLETTFLIDLVKGNISLEEMKNKFGEEAIYISSPSILELFRGIYLEANIKNVRIGEEEKIKEIISLFRILDLGKDEAILAGKIEADLENKGNSIDLEDIMIASIAITNNETLITRNKKHFEKIPNLKIESY